MGKTIPEGWHCVTPRLIVRDVAQEATVLKEAFNATGDLIADRPCQMRVDDSVVMVSGVDVRELMPAFLYLYVDDTDATYERAIKAGAESLEDPRDTPYGDRRAMVRDPSGNIWQIAMHNREASEAFMKQRCLAERTKRLWFNSSQPVQLVSRVRSLTFRSGMGQSWNSDDQLQSGRGQSGSFSKVCLLKASAPAGNQDIRINLLSSESNQRSLNLLGRASSE